MRIISFTGKAGCGKDTAANLLINSLEQKGYRTTRLSFANPLKDICTLLFGWDRERLQNDPDYKEGDTLDDGSPDPACELLGKNRRVVMQEVGTEAMRNGLHPDIWIIALRLAIMRGEYDEYDYGILSDARFLNELRFVKDLDGTRIKLERIGEQGTLTAHTQHASEVEWEQWDDWSSIVINHIWENESEAYNLRHFQEQLEIAIDYEHIPVRGPHVTREMLISGVRGMEDRFATEWDDVNETSGC